MKNFKQPLLTIFVIFATAYVLTIVGCSPSNGGSKAAPVVNSGDNSDNNQTDSPLPESGTDLTPLDPAQLRECTNDEFSELVNWSKILKTADDMVASSKGVKNTQIINAATTAIKKCDQLQYYHSLKPCKKTKTTRNVTTPDQVQTEVKAYDAFRIHQRCESVENYLKKFNMRPNPVSSSDGGGASAPVNPPSTVTPLPQQPNEPPGSDTTGSQLRQCSSDEFVKLNQWRAALDASVAKIVKMGRMSDWKYDSATLAASKLASDLCESVIKYHQSQPCRKEKEYTSTSLKIQCADTRQYFYNFAQRTDNFVIPQAQLYLDTTIFKSKTFDVGPAHWTLGQCVLTNVTDHAIQLNADNSLLVLARVYTDPQYQMFVAQTQEGLKLECYGLEYTSTATSLTEVMKLLSQKQTTLKMFYQIN